MALIYENRVPSSSRKEFVKKVNSISKELGIQPNWLMAIMYFESAKTFSPSIKNKDTNAVGLIQFMPSTAVGLGTSTSQLEKMTAVQQLDFVKKYLLPYKSRMKSYVDTYFSVFFPLAIGKPNDWVLKTNNLSAGLIARQNPAFDTNKDGKITVGEVKAVMLKKLPSEWLNDGDFGTFTKAYKKEFTLLIIGLGLIALGGAYLYVRRKK
jgi:LPXTG-motif cell wall-anchored protein